MAEFIIRDRSEDEETDRLKAIRNKIELLTDEEYLMLKDLLTEDGIDNEKVSAIESCLYKSKPPTPRQFLDWREKWLPKDFIDGIYDEIKQDFYNIFENPKYNTVSYYGSTGWGKSVSLRLAVMYSTIWYHHLLNPQKFFGKLSTTALCLYFASYKFDKSRQLLLEPIFKLFRISERFQHVDLSAKVFEEQEKHGTDKIIWSKAPYNKDGEVTLASGLKYYLGNDNPDEIRGADLWQYYVTEISYFVQQDGITEDQVHKIIMDAKNRVYRTMPNKEYAWVWIDTSARSKSSIIEKYITNTIASDSKAYHIDRRRWDVDKLCKEQCPIFYEDRSKVFEIITGDGTTPPKIIESPLDKVDVNPTLIKSVPIDYRKAYEEDLITAIRDISGYATSDEGKFINSNKIVDNMFDTSILNIEGGIIADTSDIPELLIWNKFPVDKYFRSNSTGALQLRRSPNEPRFLGFDLAKSSKGDITGISMCHWEWSREKDCKIIVYDFCFAILPGETGINLKAVTEFVLDLIRLGNVSIIGGFVDRALSDELEQDLNRVIKRDNGKFIEHNSVDASINDYQTLLSAMYNGLVKTGRNIFLKNNLLCLDRQIDKKTGKEKIDHPLGKTNNVYDGNWNMSTCGINAKDVSDSFCQAHARAKVNPIDVHSSIFEENNEVRRDKPGKDVLKSSFKMVLPLVAR